MAAVLWGTMAAGSPAKERGAGPMVDHWVRQLSHDSYVIREAASGNLLEAGIDATEPLRQVVESPDPEVRMRARYLLVLIEQSEFQRRLEAFATDVDDRLSIELPGWKEFRAIAGSDATARALFVQMQRHEKSLLGRVFGDKDADVEGQVALRLARLIQWHQPAKGYQDRDGAAAAPPLGSCAAVFLVGATAAAESGDRLASGLVQLARRPPLDAATSDGTYRHQVRKLLSHWIIHSESNSPNLIHQKLQLLTAHGLQEALPLAIAVAHNKPPHNVQPPIYRALAVLSVGKLGTDAQVEELQSLLDDTTVCHSQNKVIQGGQESPAVVVELRDVVLAVLVQRSGQELTDYGFHEAKHEEQWLLKYRTLGFADQQRRKAALADWRRWQTEHR